MSDIEAAPPRHEKFARGARLVLIDDDARAGAGERLGGDEPGGPRANHGAERSGGVVNVSGLHWSGGDKVERRMALSHLFGHASGGVSERPVSTGAPVCERKLQMNPEDMQQIDAGGELFAFTVAEDAAGTRLDRYLAERPELVAAHLSRSRIKGLIEEGRVALRGAPARDPARKLSHGDTVTLDVPPPEPAEPLAEDIALEVVYEDDHLIVIDKPAGLVVHPASGHETGTLVNALIAHCGESLSGVGGVKKPGIVHRIDKDTTGLLVVAKTDAAHHGLSAPFRRPWPHSVADARISGLRLGRPRPRAWHDRDLPRPP